MLFMSLLDCPLIQLYDMTRYDRLTHLFSKEAKTDTNVSRLLCPQAKTTVKTFVVSPDSSDKLQATDTSLQQDPSGWTMYSAMDQRRLLATVLTTVGAHTTVVTRKTCQSYASTRHLGLHHRRQVTLIRLDFHVLIFLSLIHI